MTLWQTMADNPSLLDFQTPPNVCSYMVKMIPPGVISVYEPSPGQGNLAGAIVDAGYECTVADNFFLTDPKLKFDCVVMNPPFSSKYAFGIPEGFDSMGMRLGYYFLTECMQKSDNIIALMPWFTISDSDVRLRAIKKYGLKSITALPRKTFKYARIQTCIFELQRGYSGETAFKVFEFETTD